MGIFGAISNAWRAAQAMIRNLIYGLLRVRFFGPTAIDVSIGTLSPKRFILSEGSMALDVTMGDNQFTNVHVQGLDANNQPVPFATAPQWNVDRPDVAMITADPDGLTCRVEAAIPPVLGVAVVTVSVPDDPNVPPLTINFTIESEGVVRLDATVDTPQDRPAP